MSEKEYWIGIDFGNATSCAAVWNGRHAEIIEMPDGRKSLPSAVAIVDGKGLLGQDALDQGRAAMLADGSSLRDYLFRYFKQRMGEVYHEEAESGHQTMADPKTGLVAWRGPDGFVYQTVELASYIIEALLKAAEAKLGKRPNCAVITVPAEASEAQKSATIEAGKMAGLTRVELMHEPTAAALAYGFDFSKPRRIAVIDHGAGTIDISIIQTGKGRNGHSLVEVKATDGRRRGLGGMDFDRLVAKYLASRWRTLYPDSEISSVAFTRIMDQAEAAKIRLSGRDETKVRVPELATDRNGVSLTMDEPLDIRTFNEIIVDMRVAIASLCRRAVEKAKEKDPNFSIADINDVVLVGGMTRCLAVRDAIKSVFGKEPRKDINPEEAVALGAAIEAARLSGRMTGLTVRDIISQTFAIETLKDVPAIIFPSGTPYPAERTVTIRNANDGQEALSIAILEGSQAHASECTVLANYDHLVEPLPAKGNGILLKCRLDESGRFSAETETWKYETAA